MPVVPTLLLNGAHGIGTGWSTTVHKYHPLEVVDNVCAHLHGQPMKPLTPWCRVSRPDRREAFERGGGADGSAAGSAASGAASG